MVTLPGESFYEDNDRDYKTKDYKVAITIIAARFIIHFHCIRLKALLISSIHRSLLAVTEYNFLLVLYPPLCDSYCNRVDINQ